MKGVERRAPCSVFLFCSSKSFSFFFLPPWPCPFASKLLCLLPSSVSCLLLPILLRFSMPFYSSFSCCYTHTRRHPKNDNTKQTMSNHLLGLPLNIIFAFKKTPIHPTKRTILGLQNSFIDLLTTPTERTLVRRRFPRRSCLPAVLPRAASESSEEEDQRDLQKRLGRGRKKTQGTAFRFFLVRNKKTEQNITKHKRNKYIRNFLMFVYSFVKGQC